MKISARNQLKGKVVNILEGAVNGVVSIAVGNDVIKADITLQSIKELGLVVDGPATAVIKASSVMFATEKPSGLSARNQLEGTITSVKPGAVNGHVTIALPDGGQITGSITNEGIESLGLAEGKKAYAVIKATDVMVAVD